MKLFCFPYAGGGFAAFNAWKPYLDQEIDLMPIELAGRGRRIYEKGYSDFDAVLQDILSLIGDDIKDGNYMFFGHSMGAKIAFELSYRILAMGQAGPKHLFLSGRGAPNILGGYNREYDKLPDEEFKKELVNFGGTPKEFFEHPELVELFLPLLKNDFRLANDDIDYSSREPLSLNISVFIGKKEAITKEQVDAWKNHTQKECVIHYFEGGHFFINEKIEEVTAVINKIAKNLSKPIHTDKCR